MAVQKRPWAIGQRNISHTWVNIGIGMTDAGECFARRLRTYEPPSLVRLALAGGYAEAPNTHTITLEMKG